MSIIEINGVGYTEENLKNNWSAEYAKRLSDELIDKHNSDISDLHNELDIETAARESAVGAINGSIDEITDQLSSLSSKHDTDIAKIKNTFASTTQAGLIKLGKDGTGANKSGLVVDSSDGTCNVYCDEAYGTVRTGGRVATAPATISDIDGRAQTHKPITPSTLEYAVNSVVGSDISSAKSNISAAQAKIKELSSAQGNLARLLAEYNLSKMTVRERIPEEHKDDMLVNETGIYIDSLDAHSNGLVGPGALFVFADSNGVDVYRFYYSHGSGFYVCSNDEWVSCENYIKYSASYVVAGNGKTPRPVRIGEWIDDRHVYRYVFGYSLNSDNSTIVSDKSVYSILSEVTKDQNTVFVVDCNAFVRMGGLDDVYGGCCIDDHYVPMMGVGFDSSRLPADYATRFDSFTGYIDFVTTSNNVI